jgi:enoyl-CoA hydratase
MPDKRETVTFEKRGAAGWIYLSRPERMNALAPESLRELWTQLGKLESDSSIRVAVFTGRGDKAFCAGMDLAGLENSTPLAARRRSREIQMLTNRIAELSLPTVAAVNGVAMGAGLEICLACDLVAASSNARFAFPEVKLGMIPCGGGTQRLSRLIGLRRARDMVITGRILDADQALQWGLVNEVVQPGELLEWVDGLVEKMAQGGKIALYQAKRCLNHSLDMDLNRGLEYETECFTTCFSSGETARGLKRYARAGEAPAGAAATATGKGGERTEVPAASQPAQEVAKETAATGEEATTAASTESAPSDAEPGAIPAGVSGAGGYVPVGPEPEPEEEVEGEEDEYGDIFE